jgi:hypothetical protein
MKLTISDAASVTVVGCHFTQILTNDVLFLSGVKTFSSHHLSRYRGDIRAWSEDLGRRLSEARIRHTGRAALQKEAGE